MVSRQVVVKLDPLQKPGAFVCARPSLLGHFVALAPFVPGFLQFIKLGVPDVLSLGDYAALELRTLHASHATQLLGPYSRFGWSHPGPAFFYLALPVYEFFHEHGAALNVFAFICNFVAAIAIVVTASKLRGEVFGLATSLLLGMYETVAARFTLSDDWNPMVPVIPIALLTFLSVRLALGSIAVLPWVVFLASAIVQTHVGYAPPVFFLIGVASLLCARQLIAKRVWRSARRRVLSSTLVALLVTVLVWALPVWENFKDQPGIVPDNLLLLVGTQFKSDRPPRFELTVTDRRHAKNPRERKGGELISSSGDLFVFLVRR